MSEAIVHDYINKLKASGLRGYSEYLRINGWFNNAINIPHHDYLHVVLSEIVIGKLLTTSNVKQEIYNQLCIFSDGFKYFLTDDNCVGSTFAPLAPPASLNDRSLAFPIIHDLIPGFKYVASIDVDPHTSLNKVMEAVDEKIAKLGTSPKYINSMQELAEYIVSNPPEKVVEPKLPTYAVIIITDDTDESGLVRFLDTDYDGVYCLSHNFPTELIFSNVDKARAKLTEILNRAEVKVVSRDGVRRPLPDIDRLLSLSDKKKFSSMSLTVMSITLTAASQPAQISGKFEKPTGFTYD